MKYYKTIFIVLQLCLAACAAKHPSISSEPVKQYSWPDEAVLAFESVSVGDNSVIDGDVSVISSNVPARIELPSFEFIEPGRDDITVGRPERLTLEPGHFGKVSVRGGGNNPAVLTLKGGTYHMEELDIGDRGTLLCEASCDIRVMGRFLAGPYTTIGRAGGTDKNAIEVMIYVGGFDSTTGELYDDPEGAVIGEGSKVAARIYSPNTNLFIGDNAEFEGGLVARSIKLGSGVRVTGKAAPSAPVSVTAPLPESRLERDAGDISGTEGDIRAFRLSPSVRIDAGTVFTVYSADLGLGPDDEMSVISSRKSREGILYVNYRQLYRGLPVLGTGYSVSEKNGRAVSAAGRVARIGDIDTEPLLSESEALKSALGAVGAEVYEWELPGSEGTPKGTLALASANYTMEPGSFRLVYRFRIDSLNPYGSEIVDVDARTGEVTGKFSNIVLSPVESVGDTLTNGSQKFIAESYLDTDNVTRYRLHVPAGSAYAEYVTTDANSVQVKDDLEFVSDENKFDTYPLKSKDELFFSKRPRLASAVEIHWGLQRAQDYWIKFGWKGVDGNGLKKFHARLMDGDVCDADSFGCYEHSDTSEPVLSFKRGIPTLYSTIGHEYAHAVIAHAVNPAGVDKDDLVYLGETAVINEGISDIFGRLIHNDENMPWCEQYMPAHEISYVDASDATCDPVTHVCKAVTDFLCFGYDIATPKKSGLPDTYNGIHYLYTGMVCDPSDALKDYCHRNSTVVTYWFYLLSIGGAGTNDLGVSYSFVGVGGDKAEKILVHTILYKLAQKSFGFEEFREVTVQAAKDLYGDGSIEADTVAKAWYAVGVGDIYPRSYSPQNVSGVDPWPVTLKWESLKGEYDWQVQVSSDPLFKTEVKTLKPGASFSQMTVTGKPVTWITSKVYLKPLTKYYWRVRSKVIKEASVTNPNSTPGNVKAVDTFWVPTGKGQVVTAKGPVNVAKVSLPYDTENEGWREWGAVQKFITGPKVPKILSPGPKYSSGAINDTPGRVYAPATGYLFSNTLGGNVVEVSTPTGPVTATGKYYPWSTEFSWESVPGAEEYRLTVSEDPGKKCTPPSGGGSGVAITSFLHTAVRIVPDDAKSGGIVKHEEALKNGDTYYWWLQAYGPEGIAGGCAYGGAPVKFETSIPKTELVSPANGAKVSPFEITLEWKEVKGATGYMLERAKGAPTFTDADELTGNTSTFSVSETGKYYWRVTPLGPKFPPLPAADIGAVSGTRYFTADLSLTKPELELPANNAYEPFGGKSVLFVWHPVKGAESYKLAVFERNADKSVGAQVALDTAGYVKCTDNVRLCQNVNNVNVNKNGYCWKVAAVGPGGLKGADSDLWCYNIGASRPAIVSPSKDQTGVEYSPVQFAWTSDYSPVGYRIEIFEETQQSGLVEIFDENIGQVNQYSKVLKPDTHYIWHIINLNPDGSAASDGSGFKTKMKPKPEETCKTLYDINSNNPSIDITYPPHLGDTAKPIYVLWNVYDAGIKEYQIKISSFNPYPPPGQAVEGPLYTSDAIPAATVTSGGTATYMVPFWVQNLNYKFYKVYVSARTGSSCSWTELDLVTFGVD